MAAPLDIVVDSPTGRRVLFVECKTTRKSTPEEAAHVRRNLLAHSQLPADAFFLLAIPSRLFLWNRDRGVDAAPNFTATPSRFYETTLGNRRSGRRTSR